MAAEETKGQVAVAPTVEKQSNCLGCGKPIQKIKRYYRDGKLYCSKKCWKTAKAKKEEKK